MAQGGPYDGTTVRVASAATGAAICEGVVTRHRTNGQRAIEVQDKDTGTTSWLYAQEHEDEWWYRPGRGAQEVTIRLLALPPNLPPRCSRGHGPMQHVTNAGHAKYGRDSYCWEFCALACEVPY
jgi:hypothetical protein